MELLAKYIDEINKDLVVTDFNIKDIQLKLPSRKHFWVARLIDAKIKREKLIKNKKNFKKDLAQRILTESPVKITVQTAEYAAENTKDMETYSDKIKEYDYIIEYLEKVEKIMGSMVWEIKNIVELNKLEQL